MTDQTIRAAGAGSAQDEREAFEAWHRSKFATKHSTGQPTRDMHNGIYAEKYGPEYQQQMWEAWQARAALARVPSRDAGQEEASTQTMTTDEAREYLVKFMEKHFTDKTYHRYIRGQRGSVNLAGDFAWQMARALRMIDGHTAGAAGGGK